MATDAVAIIIAINVQHLLHSRVFLPYFMAVKLQG